MRANSRMQTTVNKECMFKYIEFKLQILVNQKKIKYEKAKSFK